LTSHRLALRAMDTSTGQDMLWRDAGLLALGFFRVLEVETQRAFRKTCGERYRAGVQMVRLSVSASNSYITQYQRYQRFNFPPPRF
jgi:hypothetical protein